MLNSPILINRNILVYLNLFEFLFSYPIHAHIVCAYPSETSISALTSFLMQRYMYVTKTNKVTSGQNDNKHIIDQTGEGWVF